jgi:hypothetical protein
MLLRLGLLVLGLVELLWPRQLVDFWMDVATRNGDDVELRPWVYTVARAEGVVLLLWALRPRQRES